MIVVAKISYFFIPTGLLLFTLYVVLVGQRASAAQAPILPWALVSRGEPQVIPYVSADKKTLFVDFDGPFNNILSIDYSLTYNTTSSGLLRAAQGTFLPSQVYATGSYSGIPYVKRQMTLGTCSAGGTCSYDLGINRAVLTLTIKALSGRVDHYTKVLSIPDSQFR